MSFNPPESGVGGVFQREAPPVRKKEFVVMNECDHWNFLKGSGPAAPSRIQTEPIEPKTTHFKPTWKTKKPVDKIDPHRPSYEHAAFQEARAEAHRPGRAMNLNARDKQIGYNPISGAPYSHERSPFVAGNFHNGDRGARGKKKLPERPAASVEETEKKAYSAHVRQQLRAERQINQGLRPGARIATVAHNFDPVL